jgi:hypothetical protein
MVRSCRTVGRASTRVAAAGAGWATVGSSYAAFRIGKARFSGSRKPTSKGGSCGPSLARPRVGRTVAATARERGALTPLLLARRRGVFVEGLERLRAAPACGSGCDRASRSPRVRRARHAVC